MSDTPQGEGWWQASDGKWYPRQSGSGPPAPVLSSESWWVRLGKNGRIAVVAMAVLVVLAVIGGAVVSQSSDKPAEGTQACQDRAVPQAIAAGFVDPAKPETSTVIAAYTNRCLAQRNGISPCGWELRAAGGDKPVAGCREWSSLPVG